LKNYLLWTICCF